MSNEKPSGDSSRRHFLSAAALASAAFAVPTAVAAQGVTNKNERGLYKSSRRAGSGALKDKVADFSYQNDALAQLIVDMWLGNHKDLITPEGTATTTPTAADYKARSDAAKTALAQRGLLLQLPIVITEKEYVDGFSLADAGLLDTNGENIGVVFVLPRPDRPTIGSPSPPAPLLETAKFLMGITPNGI